MPPAAQHTHFAGPRLVFAVDPSKDQHTYCHSVTRKTMLALCLIVAGVLALLQSSSTFVLPGAAVRRWPRVATPINPTIHYPRSVFMLNTAHAGNSVVAQPASQSSAPNPPVNATGPGLLLSDLKTGVKLTGVVASSTPYAAFIDAGNDIHVESALLQYSQCIFYIQEFVGWVRVERSYR